MTSAGEFGEVSTEGGDAVSFLVGIGEKGDARGWLVWRRVQMLFVSCGVAERSKAFLIRTNAHIG